MTPATDVAMAARKKVAIAVLTFGLVVAAIVATPALLPVTGAFARTVFLCLADFWDQLWGFPGATLVPPAWRRLSITLLAFGWSVLLGSVQERVVGLIQRRTGTDEDLLPEESQSKGAIAIGLSVAALLVGVSGPGFDGDGRYASAMVTTYLTFVALALGTLGTLGIYREIRRGVVHRRGWWTSGLTLMVLVGMFLALLDIAATMADYQPDCLREPSDRCF